jgi:hypothetical protein
MLSGLVLVILTTSTAEQARAAFAARQFERSALLFEEAAQANAKGEAWFNAGLAWFRADKPARAIRAYTMAVEAGGVRPALRSELSRRMTELRKKTVELRLTREDDCEVQLDDAPVSEREWVMPGLHQLRASCGGTLVSNEAITLIGGEFRAFTFAAPPSPKPPPPEEPTPVLEPVPVVAPAPAPPASPRSRTFLTVSLVTAGVSAASGAASGVLWGTVEQTFQRFVASERTNEALARQGTSELTAFHLALGVALGLATLALVFLLVELASP